MQLNALFLTLLSMTIPLATRALYGPLPFYAAFLAIEAFKVVEISNQHYHRENLSLITLNIVWLTVVQKTFVFKFGYLFVHSSTVSCILKLGENRTLSCENSENLSLITSNSVWLTVVQKNFVFKFVYLFVHRSTVSCIVFGTLKKFSKCQVGGEVRNTFTTEPVYTHFPPVK